MSQKTNEIYEFGPFRLDAGERVLWRDGQPVPLQPKVFETLCALVESHGHVLDKDELLRRVWPDTFVEEVSLAKNVFVLRKALGDDREYIETIPRRGYRFVAEVWEGRTAAGQGSLPENIESDAATHPAAASPVPEMHAGRRARPAVVFALVTFGMMIGVAVWWVGFRHSSALPPTKIVPFTSLPGNEGQPSFSPDGNQIAFVWNGEAGDNRDIYVKQIGNETLLRLTSDPAADVGPSWSPDGRSIAFVREQAEDAGLYIIPSLGGAERRLAQLVPDTGTQRFISWSPDGDWLALRDRGNFWEAPAIYLISRATGEKRRLTSPTGTAISDRFPAISPDGRMAVFARSTAALVSDLHIVPVAGGEAQRLTFDSTLVMTPAWTPDGREILFVSWREGGAPAVWRMPATGGTPEKVEVAVRNLRELALAPQGHRLALTENIADENIWRLELGDTGKGQKETAQPKPLLTSTMFDANPRYSPDGKRIAFMSNRTGTQQIWLAGSNGERPVQLTAFDRHGTGSANWSPDGSQIAFDARFEGNAEIYAISVEGGSPRRLTNDPAEDINPVWSRDGKWVYFISSRNGTRSIWKTRATGGAATQVTKQAAHDCMESPDGQFLYFTRGRGVPGIWRVPVAGGEETLVTDHHRAGAWRHWTVTESGIYFATAEQRRQPLIEFFDFAMQQVSLIATLTKGLDSTTPGLSLSPDGRSLIWSQLDQEGSDIMLMENFR